MIKGLIIMMMLSFTIASSDKTKCSNEEVGRYELQTLVYTSKKGTVYIVETVLDTKTGDVVKRRKKKASSYKLPYKDRYNKVITKE